MIRWLDAESQDGGLPALQGRTQIGKGQTPSKSEIPNFAALTDDLENGPQVEGSVLASEVLRPYIGTYRIGGRAP